jgi:hypothetical protein
MTQDILVESLQLYQAKISHYWLRFYPVGLHGIMRMDTYMIPQTHIPTTSIFNY